MSAYNDVLRSKLFFILWQCNDIGRCLNTKQNYILQSVYYNKMPVEVVRTGWKILASKIFVGEIFFLNIRFALWLCECLKNACIYK